MGRGRLGTHNLANGTGRLVEAPVPIRSERAVKCIDDNRVRGCGRWYETPFHLRGKVIVSAILCPACLDAALAARDPRFVEIVREAPGGESRRRHSGGGL